AWLALPCRDQIQGDAQGRACDASQVPQQRLADGGKRDAVLQGDGCHDRRVLGSRVAVGTDLRVVDENLVQIAVLIQGNCRLMVESIAFEIECCGGAAVR